MPAPPDATALLALLEAPPGARIDGLRRLSGGANMETWSFDLVADDAREALILRRQPGDGGGDDVGELPLATESALLQVAGRHGVAVPAVRRVLADGDGLGRGYVMSRERGEALPFRLLADEQYAAALGGLARQCGEALARIHRIPAAELPPGLPDHAGDKLFQRARELLDAHGNPSPVLELAFNWLRDNAPQDPRLALVHGDFRLGNWLVERDGPRSRLAGLLDWEMVHLGDPVEDLAWCTSALWRAGTPWAAALVPPDELVELYARRTGRRVDPEKLRWYELLAMVKMASIMLTGIRAFRDGRTRDLRMAIFDHQLPFLCALAAVLRGWLPESVLEAG